MEQQYEFAFVQQYADDDVVVMDDQNESDEDSEVDMDSEVSQVDMDQFAMDQVDDSDSSESDMDEGNESGYETESWLDSDSD